MRIGLDIMGSDHGPEVPMKGAVMAARELPADVQLVLIGDPEAIAAGLAREGVDPARFEVVASHNDITMQDSATKALQSKPESSISLGFGLMKAGRLDAFASTGNTGAMLVGAVLSGETDPGHHPPVHPQCGAQRERTVRDHARRGANADCKPDVLTQFGLLGHLLAKHVYHIDEPKVALLNIGEEDKKGNATALAAYGLMKEQTQYTFIGNVEGRDLFNDKADVMVTDGFTGNIVLKAVEAFHDLLKLRGVHEPFFDRFDYENYGGLPVLGVNGNVIIGHGISNEVTIKNMVLFTREVVESRLNDRIREALV
ncbi:MAG: phosphate acyltransferase [Flavobacteriales bacterium]|nr:phosphate acyltransferase [Flavobacteriales bacterium]